MISKILTNSLCTLLCASLLIACNAAPKKDILKPARIAVEQAKDNEAAKEYAAVELNEAEKTLKQAESALKEDDIRHFAYLAERRAFIAMAIARGKEATALHQKQ